ncbi:MAG TPA: acyl-CoA dehydrogenase family protein, partial [Acidimicrobiales bacterium]|nr:acyl-CoA dehydrogenase family protein [Acidimicrobiales bacterium]
MTTTMEIDLGPKAKAFRDELRQWLEANQPPPSEEVGAEAADEADEAAQRGRMGAMGPRWRYWSEKLAEGGYLCVSWPQEFGGRGLGGIEVSVMNEEFARARVPRVTRGMGE